MLKKPRNKEFWITNSLTNKDVSLADLALTIRARESRNLLDSKHYHYTAEQLKKSMESGSLYNKRAYIKIRQYAPKPIIKPGLYISKEGRPAMPLRSRIQIENKTYEDFKVLDELDHINEQELRMSEEKFAAEYSDEAVYDDHRPALAVDNKYNTKDKEDE